MSGRLKVLLFLCCCLPAWGLAEEAIESFDVTLQVESDGQLLVTERILVQAEGKTINHGIYREIPTHYRLDTGLQRSTPVTLLGVSRDGQPERLTYKLSGRGVRYYLGSSDIELEPGRYLYELRYRVDAQLRYGDKVDGLYWNVTGNDWELPILRANVEVLLPDAAVVGAVSAYTGRRGVRGTDYEVVRQQGNRLQLTTTKALGKFEGLSVALDWPAGLVQRPSLLARLQRLYADNTRTAFGLLAVFGLLIFYLHSWFRVGRGPAKGLIVPLFRAPDGLSPAAVSYLWHTGFAIGKRATRELSITFTDLAIRGLLQLADAKTPGRFNLQPGQAVKSTPTSVEQQLLDQLFTADAQPMALHGQYQPRLDQALKHFSRGLKKQAAAWFTSNGVLWLIGLYIAIGASLALIFSATNQPNEVKELFALLLMVVVFGGLGLYSLVSGNVGVGSFAFLLFALIPLGIAVGRIGDSVALMVVLLWLQVIAFRFWLRAPTAKGRRLLDELEGYREYLQLAESDTLASASQAPAMDIALYEQHLPFAMALGVEAQWTRRFTQALERGLIAPQVQDYQPDWLPGHTSASFAVALGSSLSGLLDRTATLPPSPDSGSSADFASDGSSSSPSSGGGSSGGGGGGGGGGGW